MLLVYVDYKSNRVNYTMDFVLKRCLGVEYKLSTNKLDFIRSKARKLNYSKEPLEEELFIEATNFLCENTNDNKLIKVFQIEHVSAFFPVTGKSAIFSCDPFSIIFYMLSRYEEYQSFCPDQHKRFPAKESLAAKNNFLDQPIVDYWVQKIGDALKKNYPDLVFKKPSYQFIPSYDIDYAWAFLHKGFIRNTGALLKDLLKLNLKGIKQRLKVLLGKQKDPYDTFDYLDELHRLHHLKPIFFFLIGKYGKYDKNVSPKNKYFQALIKKISEKHLTGIHPSYGANDRESGIADEKKMLESINKQEVTISRQHYLKLTFPETYRNLIAAGIKVDYSMGFASQIGFRAGTAQAFPWYDLEKEETTELLIQPFFLMDVSFNSYLKLKPIQAIEKNKEIIQKVKAVNGTLVSIWHNNSFSEEGDWKGWRAVYEAFIKDATKT